MDLYSFLFYVFVFVVSVTLLSRLSAIVLSKVLSKLFRKSISIEYIGFFSWKNISVQLPNCSVVVDCIWISWRLFNSQQQCPMALHIGDVSVRAELSEEEGAQDDAAPLRPVSQADRPRTRSGLTKVLMSSFPTLLQYAAQLTSFHMEAVNIMLLGAMGVDSLLHVTVSGVSLVGQSSSDGVIAADFFSQQLSLKMLRSTKPSDGDQSHVAQASVSLKVSTQIDLMQRVLTTLFVEVGSPNITIYDGFLPTGLTRVSKATPAVMPVQEEFVDAPSTAQHENALAQKLKIITRTFPEEACLDITAASWQMVLQGGQRSLQFNTQSITLTSQLASREGIICSQNEDLLLPPLTCHLTCSGVEIVNAASTKLLRMTSLKMYLVINERCVQIGIELQRGHSLYNEEEIIFWAAWVMETVAQRKPRSTSASSTGSTASTSSSRSSSPPSSRSSSPPPPRKPSPPPSLSPPSFTGTRSEWESWQHFCLPVDLDLNLSDLSCQVMCQDVPQCAVRLATLHGSWSVTSDAGKSVQKPFAYIRGSMHSEQLYLLVGDSVRTPSGAMLPTRHVWGTVCAIEALDAKMDLSPLLVDVECSLHSLHLESSPSLHLIIQHVLKTVLDLRGPPRHPAAARRKVRVGPTMGRARRKHGFALRLDDFNTFFCSSVKESLLLHVDMIEMSSGTTQSTSMVEGLKFLIINRESKVLNCPKYAKLPQGLLQVKEISTNYTEAEKKVMVQLPEGVRASWDTSSHMTIFHHVKELLTFATELKATLSPAGDAGLALSDSVSSSSASSSSPSSSTSSSSSSSSSPAHSDGINAVVKVRLMEFHYKLSSKHKNYIQAKELYLVKEGGRVLKATSTEVILGFDDRPVITVQAACVEKLVDSPQLLDDRMSFADLSSKNRAWGIFMRSLDITFPHQYDFADNYTEIINIRKWLKMLHQKKRVGEEKLYADILIRAQVFKMQIDDDPFEVKLGVNYELMKDEHAESERRRELLDKKVEDLKRSHGQLLPAKKIEELYISLEKKCIEIFQTRSKSLYASTPMRQALVTFTLTGLEISALADESMNGRTNILRHMRGIDSASPPPGDDVEFSTLWCRMVRGHCKQFSLKLRDYPQSLWQIDDWHWWGKLVGAEQTGLPRAKREGLVEVGDPWEDVTVTRNMPPLKFFHDLTTDATEMSMAYGPSIESAWNQIGLAANLLNRPSVDPSKPLPFWDKSRLLFHGRLTISLQQCNMLWLTTKDPYNTTEQLDWEWTDIYLDWTNAHFLIKGNLDIFLRTASKYDDVRLIHLPRFRLDIDLGWVCNGDCNDHHSVVPCAPDKVPAHSTNQVHDSYAAFRSQNLNLKMSLDIRGTKEGEEEDTPNCLFYSSTMRWLQNFQTCVLGNVTRPIKRGKVFNNTVPKKKALSRHYKLVDFQAKFPNFQVNYWASFAKQRGIEVCLGPGMFHSQNSLQLVEVNDGLIHRPMADWSVVELEYEVGESHVYLYTSNVDEVKNLVINKAEAEKHHLASVSKVNYSRLKCKTLGPDLDEMQEVLEEEEEEVKDAKRMNTENEEKDFIHKLVVEEFRGSWTRFNRDVVLGLYDSYSKAQTLKQNLSTEALKGVKMDSSAQARRQAGGQQSGPGTPSSGASSSAAGAAGHSPSPASKTQTGHGANMLQQLLAETSTKFMVFTEETTGSNEQLSGVVACTKDDVMTNNWHVELVNSQVMLRGSDSSGYVLVCAANAQVMQRSHWPKVMEGKLTSKTTLMGNLDRMQYFATVGSPSQRAGNPVGNQADDVKWLAVSNIEKNPNHHRSMNDVPALVGSGESVGGVVSDTVGGASEDVENDTVQLQRIISRCSCHFYYTMYGRNVNPSAAAQVLARGDADKDDGDDDDPLGREEAIDSITVVHHDLDICTNSAQYSMIMDIINNLLLYVEPKRKEAMARMQHMRFALQLNTMEDQKGPIMQLQNSLRNFISHNRQIEKDLFNAHRALDDSPNDQALVRRVSDLKKQLFESKESLLNAAEDLRIMVSCYKEIQLQMALKRKLHQAESVRIAWRVEVCFSLAKWRLTEEDGQLGIADLELRHFKYSRNTKSDDSTENLMELGYVTITNLLPNDVYKEVLRPQDTSGRSAQVALRVIARGKPPVGGISMQENFEVNVVPLTIQLTNRFFKKTMAFFFPGRHMEPDGASAPSASSSATNEDILKRIDSDETDTNTFTRSGSMRSTSSDESSVSGTLQRDVQPPKPKRKQLLSKLKKTDDIDKMKERAAQNTMFLYIKIPAVALLVSYKGEKDKNIEDVHNFHLILPSLEYHNRTWTWLDFLMAMKKEYKNALVSQAIKEKLWFKIGKEDPTPASDAREDVDKARLLMGQKATNIATEEKHSSRRSLFGKGQTGH
ncbi:bridge-like lipid transfer protein family member 2 [Diadema setosum]|uniref:bridge-like lipid transfer protein family member 2 n=1 Tax=Diadema setosum TaxID=31175 RepID=UPI003B3A250B